MKTEYYSEYQCGLKDTWVRIDDAPHKLIGFARRDAKQLRKHYPGTKTRIVKITHSIVK